MKVFLGDNVMMISKWLRYNFSHLRRRNPVCLKSLNDPQACQTCPEGCFPLSMVAPGQPVKLIEIAAGHRLRRRLTELGLTPGVELKVMRDEGGPLLLAVHDSRLALGRGMAHKILVQST
jgi:Fe2+ transport system protein FeoA